MSSVVNDFHFPELLHDQSPLSREDAVGRGGRGAPVATSHGYHVFNFAETPYHARMPEASRQSHRWKIAVGVFVLSYCIQALILSQIADSRHFLPDGDDMKFYNDWARRVAAGEWTDGKAFYGLPGYAYALGAIHHVFGYDHDYTPFLIGQIQALFHALTSTFIFLIGTRVFGEKRGIIAGITASAAWLAFTPAQVFSAILMPTSWMICAFWGLLHWIICVSEKGAASAWRPWLWMGLLAGVVATTVASLLMLLPLVLCLIAITLRGKAPLWAAALAVVSGALVATTAFSAAFDFSSARLLVALAFLANAAAWFALRPQLRPMLCAAAVLLGGVYAGTSPVWLHNRLVAKDTVFLSAHDGLNFYLGNHASANGYTKIPGGLRASQEGLLRDSLTIPVAEAGRELKRSEISAYWKKKGSAYIHDHFGDWISLLGVKIGNFWNAFQYDDLSILKLLRDEGVIPPGLRFGFVAALALPGMLLCWRRWPASRWVTGAVLLHMAGLMPVFITERYRLCAVPGMILLGTGGLVFVWEKITARRWLPALACLPLFAASTWFTSRPQPDIGLWSLDFYKAGIRSTDGALLEREKGDESKAKESLTNARRNLETAYSYVQENADIIFALGNVWLHLSSSTGLAAEEVERMQHQAEKCYGLALNLSLQINPQRGHDGALNNLGFIAMERKRWADAERFFRGSLKFEADDPGTLSLLAQACREQGKTAEALAAIDAALKLRPGNPGMLKFRDALTRPPASPPPK